MSVVTKNPFALLDDGEAAEQPVSKPTTAAVTQADAPKPKPKTSSTRGGGRYYQRGGKPQAPPAEGVDQPEGEKKYDGGNRTDRGRGRGGRGGPRGGRGGRGGVDRPDRHSATGIYDSHKKIHQGWGGDRGDTEYQQETEANQDATKEAASGDNWGGDAGNTDAWGAAPVADVADAWANIDAENKKEGAEGAESKPRRRFEEEEDDGKVTYDEWQKKNTAGASEAIPKLEVRQANAGASDLFKGAVKLEKGEEDAYFVAKGKNQPGKTTEASRKLKEKQILETNFRFDRGSGFRGRGGRGGGRGGGDRPFREERPQREERPRRGGRQGGGLTSPDVDDSANFPALS